MMLKTLISGDTQATPSDIPIIYIKTALLDEEFEGRSPGLILTKEDIFNIKRYERHSLNLPVTLTGVEHALGFKKSNVPGLEPQDILHTYRQIRDHALSWSPIENNIKSVTFTIDRFAGSFYKNGSAIIESIEQMSIAQRLKLKVSDLSVAFINDLDPSALDDQDLSIRNELSAFLKSIADEVEQHRQSASTLSNSIEVFANTLTQTLIPDINQKFNQANQSGLASEITELERYIDDLTQQIAEKAAEYKKNVALAFSGAPGGAFGLIITGGIFGKKAEDARKAKNRLLKEKDAALEKLKVSRPLLNTVASLAIYFEDMQFRMLDAHRSAVNLRDIWMMLSEYIQAAANELETIEDNQSLLTFALKFSNVVTPWNDINGFTNKLLAVFNSALEQFNNQ